MVVQVNSGQVKFSVRLDNWQWASDGQFVDVDVVIKGQLAVGE